MRIGIQTWGTEGDVRPCMARRARAIGSRMAGENGVARAVSLIEDAVSGLG